jgi:hypothetical protein
VGRHEAVTKFYQITKLKAGGSHKEHKEAQRDERKKRALRPAFLKQEKGRRLASKERRERKE